MYYTDYETLRERFAIMTIDGLLSDSEALKELKPNTTLELYNKLQVEIWKNKDMSYKIDSKEDRMYTDEEIINLEKNVIKKLGGKGNVTLIKKIVNMQNGYKVADYLLKLDGENFPKRCDNVYWSNYIMKGSKVLHHNYQFDNVEKDAQKLDYELSLYVQNNKKVVS